jgi:hypothetical protein
MAGRQWKYCGDEDSSRGHRYPEGGVLSLDEVGSELDPAMRGSVVTAHREEGGARRVGPTHPRIVLARFKVLPPGPLQSAATELRRAARDSGSLGSGTTVFALFLDVFPAGPDVFPGVLVLSDFVFR